MGIVVALGERELVDPYALAGAVVLVAEDPDAVRTAWIGLPADTALVIMTARADETLGRARLDSEAPLSVVMRDD